MQAGLAWVVAWTKPEFSGRQAALAEREAGHRRHLMGIVTDGRRPPRAGCTVSIGGRAVGEVTSGNFSPVLEQGIALAFLPPETSEGQLVSVDVRGKPLTGHVVRPPFVKR